MNMIKLELYGKSFAACFTLNHTFRISQEMREDACLAYVQTGEQEVYAATQKMTASPNESILMKCGNYVANFPGASPTSEFRSVVFHLDPISIKKAFGNEDLSFLQTGANETSGKEALKLNQNLLLDSFVQSLTLYFDNPELCTEALLATKLRELVYILSDSGKNKIATQIIGTIGVSEPNPFKDVIEANLYTHLSIPELAHLTHRSESTFKRDFKKYFNESPAKFFKTKRLEKAAKMVLSSSLQINEIAFECGFENAAHFSDSFHTHFGTSPKEYVG